MCTNNVKRAVTCQQFDSTTRLHQPGPIGLATPQPHEDPAAGGRSREASRLVAFASPNVGSFLGVSIEGAVLATRHDLNEALYGKGAKPKAILDGYYPNSLTDALRLALRKN